MAGYIGWRNSFLGIHSWVPQTFKNKGTGGDNTGVGGKGGLRGGRGDRGGDDLCPGIWGAYVHRMFQQIQNNTLSSLFRGVGAGRGVYIPRNRLSVRVQFLENYSARSSSSFCEIRNTSSSLRTELESEKKGTARPRPRPRSIDPSFLQQPCLQLLH